MASTLAAGDVAVVGFNTAQSDSSGQPATTNAIYFVLLAPITNGTVIYFTDRTWNGSAFSTSGTDGTFTYTAGADLPAGTVITLSSAQLLGAGIDLDEAGEALYVFQGTNVNTPTTFLYAVEFGDGNTTFNASLSNTGLTNGVNALAVDLDSGAYSGPSTQQDSYLKNGTDLVHAISDPNNWYGDNRDTVNALVQPPQGTFLTSPDIQIWGAAAGGGDGIIRIDADATTGLGVQLNQVRIYTSDGDEGAAFQNLFVAPRDIVIDTVHGKFFIADSDLAGTNRILQGNLSDLLGSPGTVPTVTVLYSDATAGVNGQIRNLIIDPEHGYVFFSHAVNNAVQRVNYDTAGQTPSTIVNLGTASGNPNGTTNNFVDDFVYDTVHDTLYITSHRVTAAADGDVISRNYIYKVTGVSTFSGTTFTFTGGNVTVLPFSPDDDDAGVLTTPGEAFPREFGSLEGIAINAAGTVIYFATASVLEDTDGDGGTGGGSGTAPVLRPGGIYSYALTGNAAGTFTQIYVQTIGGAGPQGLLDELEIDETSGRYYVHDTTGGTAQPGDEGIWTGLLSGGTPVKISTISNINGLLLDGFEINRSPTLTVTTSSASYTETAGASSGFNTPVQLISAATAADTDTSGFTDQLNGAIVRISNGFLQGATHQDRLTINGTTSGTLDFGSQDITYSYDSTTGVMTLTGASTFANYQAALVLVRYSVSGDNPTNYGTDGSRTISWSVSDGLVSSDEQQVSVTVTGVNDNPVNTVGSSQSVNEDATVVLTGISIADPDADPASQNVTVTLSVTHGTLDIRTDVAGGVTAGQVTGDTTGSITITATQNQINATLANATGLTYAPAANYYGSDNLTVQTSDNGLNGTGGALTDTDLKAITVNAVNDAPVLTPVSETAVTYTENGAAVGLLATGDVNDDVDLPTNFNGGSFRVQITGGAVAGDQIVVLGSSGFSVSSGNLMQGATVIGTVTGSGTSDFTVTLNTNATPSVVDALVKAFGFQSSSDNPGSGDRTITFTFNDGGAVGGGALTDVSTQVVHVTAVNDAPVNVAPSGATGSEDTTFPITGLSITDADDNGATVTVTLSVAHGVLTINTAVGGGLLAAGVSGNGTNTVTLTGTKAAINTTLADATGLQFHGDANYNGADTLHVVTNDGGATGTGGAQSDTDDYTIIVTAVNDAPDLTPNAPSDVAWTEATAAVQLNATGVVSDVDSPVNYTGGSLRVQITTGATAGDQIDVLAASGFTVSAGNLMFGGNAIGTVTGQGTSDFLVSALTAFATPSVINSLLEAFGFSNNTTTPTNTDRVVTFTFNDGGNIGTGGGLTDAVTQTIHVTDLTGGVANDDDVSTNENVVLSGNVENNNGHGADTGVTNVTEVNGVGANVGTQITLPSGALLTVNADGTFSYDPNGQFNYLGGPTSGASNITATDSFTYTVDGGDTATVTVTINGVDSNGDILQGTAGGDDITGGIGNDTLNGLGGNDDLGGGDGNDIVNGGDNDDTLNGNDGNDKLNGDNGTDTLNGGLGADLIHGGAGDDHIFGGDNNDNMFGDGGNDDMHGGAGNDVYNVEDAGDTVDENPGEGTDIVRESLANYTLSANVENLEMQGSGDINGTGNASNNNMTGTIGNNTLQGLDGNDTLNGLAGKDNLQGGNGNDIINGGDDNDTVDGGADNDNIHGDAGNDIVSGGDGADVVYGDEGNDKVNGNAGADNLYGGNGADQLSGGEENDHLYGGGDNDNLDGGTGADYMEGGTGNDVYIVDNTGDGAVELSGEGFDIVRNSVNFTLGDNIESMEMQGSANINGTGNALVNNMTGNTGDNQLKGLAGNDTLNGGGGNDTLTGGVGNDQMTGGAGFDTFVVLQESIGTPSLETDFVYDLNMAGGDRIDLSAIDADSGLAGNQAFTFVASFSHHAGEATLTYDSGSGFTFLRLDVNGDGTTDYQMKITGDVTATATNINTGGEPAGDGGWIL